MAAGGHFGFWLLTNSAAIFARVMGAKFFLNTSKSSNQVPNLTMLSVVTGPPDCTQLIKVDMRHQNIKNIEHDIKTVNWNQILECDGAGLAYSTFHTAISEKYNKCFLLRNSSVNRYTTNNNPWLTSTLKEYIKVKNKLYINRNKGDNKEARLRWYKQYRNILNHIWRMTERKYYQHLKKIMASSLDCHQ